MRLSHKQRGSTRYLRQILIFKPKVLHIFQGNMVHQYKTKQCKTTQLHNSCEINTSLGYLQTNGQPYCPHKMPSSFETLQKGNRIHKYNILDCYILLSFPCTKFCRRQEKTVCLDISPKDRDSRTNPASSQFAL